jgi:hypothetical protein
MPIPVPTFDNVEFDKVCNPLLCMYRLQALAPERTQQGCSHQVQKQEETEGANSGQGNFKLCKVFF